MTNIMLIKFNNSRSYIMNVGSLFIQFYPFIYLICTLQQECLTETENLLKTNLVSYLHLIIGVIKLNVNSSD